MSFLLILLVLIAAPMGVLSKTGDEVELALPFDIDDSEITTNQPIIALVNETNLNTSNTASTNEMDNETSTMTTTTTTISTTTKPNFELREPRFCGCDKISSSCEPNCCCDADCDDSDRLVFTACMDEHRESNFCYDTKPDLFGNNSDYVFSLSLENLFCLHDTNAQSLNSYRDRKAIKDVGEFNKLARRHGSMNTWLPMQTRLTDLKENNFYMFGDPILCLKHNETRKCSIPSTSPSDNSKCLGSRPLYFLRQMSGLRCGVDIVADDNFADPMSNSSATCSNLFNISHYFEDTYFHSMRKEGQLISPEWHVCTRDESVCLEVTDQLANYYLTNDCKNNLMTRLIVKIEHEGILGIKRVLLKFHVDDQPDSNRIIQTFGYNHVWLKNKSNVSEEIEVRSHKNYRKGSVLRVAHVEDHELRLDEVLTVFKEAPNCHDSLKAKQRRRVRLGESIYVGCQLELSVPSDSQQVWCRSQREQVLSLLLGSMWATLSSNDLRLASTGNASSNEDWLIPLITNAPVPLNAPCSSGLTTKLNLEVIYQKIGLFRSPQIRIIGWHLNFNFPENFGQKTNVEMAVGFVDATMKAQHEYRRMPVIKASFPQDFFYPFTNIALNEANHLHNLCLVSVLSTLLLPIF